MYRLTTLIFLSSIVSCFSQNAGKWTEFESTKFGFRILLPRQPSFSVKTIITEDGPQTMNMFMYVPPPEAKDVNTFYGINITRYPGDSLDHKNSEKMNAFFKSAVDGSAQSVSGELVHVERVDFNGYPGRDYRVVILNGSVALRAKMIVVDDTVYTLTTITDKENDFNKSISKFIDSFELLKEK